jgi:hypothetical protein
MGHPQHVAEQKAHEGSRHEELSVGQIEIFDTPKIKGRGRGHKCPLTALSNQQLQEDSAPSPYFTDG